jgi:hypothetical protein
MCRERNLVESSGTEFAEMKNTTNKVCLHACIIPMEIRIVFSSLGCIALSVENK